MTGLDGLHAQYSDAYEKGGYVAAEPFAEKILAEVDRWWLRGNAQAQVLHAQMRYTLARAALDRGDVAGAEKQQTDGMRAATRAAQLGDPRSAFETVMLLITGAEIRLAADDIDGAIAGFDEAKLIEDASDHPQWGEAQVHLQLGRQWALQVAGRFDESEQAAQSALDLASQHEPRLVPMALERMSMIRRLTGASDEGDHHLQAAAAIGRSTDIGGPQRAELARHLASRAIERGDLDEAERQLDEAEREYLAIGDRRRASGALVGRAEVLRQRGDLDGAIEAARRAEKAAAEVSETTGRIEALTVLGSALDDAGRGDDALAVHDTARALAADAGDRLELVRVDVRRVVTAFNIAARIAQDAQRGGAFGQAAASDAQAAALERAADIAVPVALAADAVRFAMPAGVIRERWTREVCLPVGDSALQTLTALGRADEIADLLEHIAASASLEPVSAIRLPVVPDGPDPEPDLLDPPPRVRTRTDGVSPIGWAVEAAEERYGFAARSAQEVDAW